MNEKYKAFSSTYPANLQWLIETYFSNPSKRISLKKGEVLIEEGDINERLYLVLSGVLRGYTKTPDGMELEAFRATKHRFVGGPSFFSKSFTSLTTVVAQVDSEVAYIDQDQEAVVNGESRSLEEQFMPVLVMELVHRQHRIQKISVEKEKALKALIQSEKMVSLGQISAGIAHELNNAVAVVKRNGDWFSRHVAELMREMYPDHVSFFMAGLQKGRRVSSREARKKSKDFIQRYRVSEHAAFPLAQTGIGEDMLNTISQWSEDEIHRMTHFWEMGATLNDMLVAANHAVHVVQSVKTLGAQQSERKPGLDVNECIDEAITLLASVLRQVSLENQLTQLPPIVGSKGEIVQVLVNIMQNACESMISSQVQNPVLIVRSFVKKSFLVITIQDNGPGIPSHILPHIFEPAITTKTDTKKIGLGLGLTICQRIIHSYGGSIQAESCPGKTTFVIRIPTGGNHAENPHLDR